MITFTGDPIYIGPEYNIFQNSCELHFDFISRSDKSIVATVYALKGGVVIGTFQTAYTVAQLNAKTLAETDTAAMFSEAIHLLEKDRLEALNPTNTFTITL